MESNRQSESEEAKLRRQLDETLRFARLLEDLTRAPANLPRVQEPSRPALPVRHFLLPGEFHADCPERRLVS